MTHDCCTCYTSGIILGDSKCSWAEIIIAWSTLDGHHVQKVQHVHASILFLHMDMDSAQINVSFQQVKTIYIFTFISWYTLISSLTLFHCDEKDKKKNVRNDKKIKRVKSKRKIKYLQNYPYVRNTKRIERVESRIWMFLLYSNMTHRENTQHIQICKNHIRIYGRPKEHPTRKKIWSFPKKK